MPTKLPTVPSLPQTLPSLGPQNSRRKRNLQELGAARGLEGIATQGNALKMASQIWSVIFSEAQSWRKRNMTHQCSHERAPASAHASAHASVHESAHQNWHSFVIIPYKGSHSSAHVSAHAGAHASVHEVVLSYVTWSVFTCSVPYPYFSFKEDHQKIRFAFLESPRLLK